MEVPEIRRDERVRLPSQFRFSLVTGLIQSAALYFYYDTNVRSKWNHCGARCAPQWFHFERTLV